MWEIVIMSKIYNGYPFKTPIVGESNYFDTIKKCYNDQSSFKFASKDCLKNE